MSGGDFGWRAAVTRIVGSTAFVVLTLPFGPVPPPQGMTGLPVSLAILGAVLILSAHAYLALRAWYALHVRGLLICAIATVCLETFAVTSIDREMNVLNIAYITISGYLSLIYAFGLIYNHIDGKLSGLVHAKDVY